MSMARKILAGVALAIMTTHVNNATKRLNTRFKICCVYQKS